MKTTHHPSPSNIKRLKWANHFFFATALLFVIHQNALNPEQARIEVPIVAQALHYQPQTPPPAFDIDQLSGEEIDFAVRPE